MIRKMLGMAAAAILLSSYPAGLAASAELSVLEKYKEFKQAGIFQGGSDGEVDLERTITRAELAVVLTRLMKLDTSEDKQSGFADLEGHWVAKTSAVSNMVHYKIMNGKGYNRFDPNGLVTVEELSAVLTRTLKLETSQTTIADAIVSDWARAYVAIAVDAGLIDPREDYTVPVTRGMLVDAIFIEYQTMPLPVS
ncbi:S-layer family protein [Paenibacillus methanolicus]|uniref:S-layer family protein n=1 Tax=Paenibacillus methanolicus TaxID=582686 RepID=A0A5S5C0W8_9BACL|nr:S-layer family protein [Paenibacillus methanolicus]